MATNSLIGWNNLAKAATISATSAATNLSAVNVAGDSGSPSSAWQTVFGVTTATLTITPLLAARSWDVISIHRTNLTAGATVVVSLITAPATTVWTTTVSGPVSGYGQVVVLPPAGTIADWVTIQITDSACPDGFLNVPLVFCGPAWRPLGSAGFSSSVGRDVTTADVTSRGGQEYPALYFQRRRWNVAFPALRTSETWGYADVLNSYSAAGSNVLFLPDTTSAYINQEAVFGRLKATADITYPLAVADRRAWSASISERL